MKRLTILSILLLAVSRFFGSACHQQSITVITVHVASSAAPAVAEIAASFERETGIHVRLNQASSSTLARQIDSGAPADLFLSANVRWMDVVSKNGRVEETSDLLRNRLVVVVPLGPRTPPSEIPVGNMTKGRIAMGDPSHVPAGEYATQSLQRLGWFGAIQNRLAPCVNARAALRLVEQKEVDCGVVYRSDSVTSNKVMIVQTLPETSHDPILYPLGLMKGCPVAARKFFDYLKSGDAITVFRRHGFLSNDSSSAGAFTHND